MDTPESLTQSPHANEEEEKDLSDSELLDSPDEEEDRLILDSEIVHDEENGAVVEEDEEEMESKGRGSELEDEREEEDEVVPDFVSDPEDEEPLGEIGDMGQEVGTFMLMVGDEGGPQGNHYGREEEKEEEEQGDRVTDSFKSPDSESEQSKSFIAEDIVDGGKGYNDYQKEASAEPESAAVNDEEEDRSKVEEEDEDEMIRAEERRRAAAMREMKDDSTSVSRELDEHELDYDEEVPEEPSIPAHEEEDDEEEARVEREDEEESEDKSSKKEKKTILPLSPKESDRRRTDNAKETERVRRDSFRDKKNEDDGEIDEGEIDVSDRSFPGNSEFISVR